MATVNSFQFKEGFAGSHEDPDVARIVESFTLGVHGSLETERQAVGTALKFLRLFHDMVQGFLLVGSSLSSLAEQEWYAKDESEATPESYCGLRIRNVSRLRDNGADIPELLNWSLALCREVSPAVLELLARASSVTNTRCSSLG